MKNITTGKQKRPSVCGNCSIFLYNLIKNEVKKLNEAAETDYQAIAENVYRFRVLQGLTQAKLAELSGVSSSYISQIECVRLHKGITCTTIAQIAETLGVPTCVLFAHKPCPEYLECLGSITEKIVRH